MKNSLRKALEVHPKLTRLYICTPRNFSPAENDWLLCEFSQENPETREIELLHLDLGD